MSNPFSLRIFVADGDPNGLRMVERSNWTGGADVSAGAAAARQGAGGAGPDRRLPVAGPARGRRQRDALHRLGRSGPPAAGKPLRAKGLPDPRGVLRGRAGGSSRSRTPVTSISDIAIISIVG